MTALLEESFIVLPFTPANLAISLSNQLTSDCKIKEKMHYKYFLEYLGSVSDGLAAKTIVVENKYISKSYLNDYSNYYSTCFTDYSRFCKRVHFFSEEFTKRQLGAAIRNHKARIWKSYLGYIVVKPLPILTIGATLLKTYHRTDKNRRRFPVTKEYKVNLFGKELTVNSLAFQEQDSVVGACASSALWSAFHKTSQLFQTPLPSPSDITKSAKNLFQSSGRIYPSGGLDHYQIGSAIEAVGLVSELRNSDSFTSDIGYLKSFIYSYCKMGLPILLGIRFPDGDHLITVTGYKEEKDVLFGRTQKMSLKASTIERFYTHDDQVGPFSRLGFNENGDIITSWWTDLAGTGKKIASLVSLFIPIHNKIRLTFENIYSKVRMIDFYFFQRIASVEIYWDIYIDFSNEYKKSVSHSNNISNQLKHSLLTGQLPKYVWIAKGIVKEECIIELLFDATQIASADYCIRINVFNDSLKTILLNDLLNPTIVDYLVAQLGYPFLQLLRQSLK